MFWFVFWTITQSIMAGAVAALTAYALKDGF